MKIKNLQKKGQMIIMDMLIAVLIAMLLFATIVNFFSSREKSLSNDRVYEDMHIQAFLITDLLSSHQGDPKGWNLSTLQTIGLGSEKNIIDENKLALFLSMDYDPARDSLNIKPMDFFFHMEFTNGTPINGFGQIGQNDSRIVNVERIVLYQNKTARLYFSLSKGQ